MEQDHNSANGVTNLSVSRTWFCLAAVLFLLWPTMATAQRVEELPGFVDFGRFGHFDLDDLTVEINLGGGLLKMLSSAVEDEDGDFAELLHGLSLVKVNIFKVPNTATANEALQATVNQLRSDGWEAVVSIRDKQNLHILLRTDGDSIQGLLAAFSDDESFGMVNIVGNFDPEQIGRLARQLDIGALEDLDLNLGNDDG